MISEQEQKVYDVLEELGLAYERFEHPPVYTVEEAQQYWKDIDAMHCKNLFLRNNKGNMHYLVILEETKQADLGRLSELLLAGRLSFASDRRLTQYLGLESGAVSPFGLINDADRAVTVALDKDIKRAKAVSFHPNVNTATISFSTEDFLKFLKHCGNEIIFI